MGKVRYCIMSNYGFVAMAFFALFPIILVRKDFERLFLIVFKGCFHKSFARGYRYSEIKPIQVKRQEQGIDTLIRIKYF